MSGADLPNADGADRIVLSYRSPAADEARRRWPLADDDWIRRSIRRDSYLGYLRTVHGGRVEPGDEWEEFVSGGCGSSTDLVFRVEAVEGGSVIVTGTDFRVVHGRERIADGSEREAADRPELDG